MKRKIVTLLFAIAAITCCAFAALSLSACGDNDENSSPVGDYKLYQMTVVGDKTYNLGESIEDGEVLTEDTMWLSVYENNTYSMSTSNEEGARDYAYGVWTKEKNGFLFSTTEDSFKVTVKNDLLYWYYSDGPDYNVISVFKKSNDGDIL